MGHRPRAFVSREVATRREECASSELIRVDGAQPGVAMRKKARGNDDDRVAWACTARSRLINQRHVQVTAVAGLSSRSAPCWNGLNGDRPLLLSHPTAGPP